MLSEMKCFTTIHIIFYRFFTSTDSISTDVCIQMCMCGVLSDFQIESKSDSQECLCLEREALLEMVLAHRLQVSNFRYPQIRVYIFDGKTYLLSVCVCVCVGVHVDLVSAM